MSEDNRPAHRRYIEDSREMRFHTNASRILDVRICEPGQTSGYSTAYQRTGDYVFIRAVPPCDVLVIGSPGQVEAEPIDERREWHYIDESGHESTAADDVNSEFWEEYGR